MHTHSNTVPIRLCFKARKWGLILFSIGFFPSSKGLLPAALGQSDTKSEPVKVNPIPLSDFRPIPKIKVQVTEVSRAKFPVVDVHTHFFHRLRHEKSSLHEFVRVMDRNQVALCVSLDATLGDKSQEHCDFLWKEYPDRFVIFCNIDFQGKGTPGNWKEWNVNQPEFVRNTVMQLREAKKNGMSGLKIFKQFGLEYRNPDGSLIAIDDARFDPIWKTCGELGFPVIMHTADPSAFFDPISETNERAEELLRHPDWAFPSPPYPSRTSLHAARNRVIERHPSTSFIAAHLGNDGEDLAQTADWLQRYPNLYVEFASRISELGRQPRAAARFLNAHSDRILFGTDGPWPEARLRLYWRFLETDDEYFPYSEKTPPPQGLWNIDGVELSDQVLEKIYFKNAEKLIPGVSERLARWRRPSEGN